MLHQPAGGIGESLVELIVGADKPDPGAHVRDRALAC
jgi:hypothetical protein